MKKKIVVVIPAFNEENSVGKVVRDIPKDCVDEVIVVDNNSSDATEQSALAEGATVLSEPKQGYGAACLKGLSYVDTLDPLPDVVVFLDADYSDYPEELPSLVRPILENGMDLVIGSRALGDREKGSMTFPQVFGNWLATTLLRWFYKVEFTDLGPFRAIRYDALQHIGMVDTNYGWTVEMQLKAAKLGLRTTEVPVTYRQRIGQSKVSGTVKGAVSAGYKILYTIFKYL
ncbi:glycosyltransferase family 2 protein [Cryomorphaceae bacterium]|nr:glycosyltransferase family 2 protein [Cryomorphaceae bacterium]